MYDFKNSFLTYSVYCLSLFYWLSRVTLRINQLKKTITLLFSFKKKSMRLKNCCIEIVKFITTRWLVNKVFDVLIESFDDTNDVWWRRRRRRENDREREKESDRRVLRVRLFILFVTSNIICCICMFMTISFIFLNCFITNLNSMIICLNSLRCIWWSNFFDNVVMKFCLIQSSYKLLKNRSNEISRSFCCIILTHLNCCCWFIL